MANPTIGATTPRIQYTATGGQTAFTVPFEFLANADLAVYVNGTLQTLTTHYTLTGANTTGGGTCTFVSGRTAGDIVTIIGNLAYSRLTNKYTKFGLLPAEVLEADFDALQVQAKQLALADQFAIRAPMTDAGMPSMTLPTKATRANKLLGFDSNGNPMQSNSSVTSMDAAVVAINTISSATSGNSASISHISSATGAVPTTVQAKLREIVSVKDFGAIGNGIADDTAAFQAAVNSAFPIYVPAGRYYISSTIEINKHKVIVFEGAIIEPYDTGTGNEFSTESSHARIQTNQDIHFFKITHHGVFIHGGTFDSSAISSHTKSIFYYDMRADRTNIWGGAITGFNIIGNKAALVGAGSGTTGVLVQFTGATGNFSYLTHCTWAGRVSSLKYGFYSTAHEPGRNQFANSCVIDIDSDGSKQVVVLNSIGDSKVKVRAQTRHVLHSTETALSQVEISTSRIDLDLMGWDADGTYDGTVGAYKPATLLENNDASTRLFPFRNVFGRQISLDSTATPTNPMLIDGARGVVPIIASNRNGFNQFDVRKLYISALDNRLIGTPLRAGTYTIGAYDGTGVNFSTLITTSAAASIPSSTNVTLAYTGNLFTESHATLAPSFTWNATGIANSDYVEIYATSMGLRGQLWWLAYTSYASVFQKIQFIGINAGSVVFNNIVENLPTGDPVDYVSVLKHHLLSRINFTDFIIRFIGATTTSAIEVHDIGFVDDIPRSDSGAFVRAYDNVNKWGQMRMISGDIYMNSSAWDGGTLIRLGNYRLWVDSSGRLRIKSGAPASDTDGTIVGTQT